MISQKLKWFTFFVNVVFWFSIVIFAISITFKTVGIVINDSKSIPVGVYVKTDKNLIHGNYVMLCGNDDINFKLAIERQYFGINKGNCPKKQPFLMKEIVAVQGDKVIINSDGIYVNDVLIPNTKALKKDLLDRKLYPSKLDKILEEKEYLVVGKESKFSFDSRYFGIIKEEQIISSIRPILLKEKFNEIIHSGKT